MGVRCANSRPQGLVRTPAPVYQNLMRMATLTIVQGEGATLQPRPEGHQLLSFPGDITPGRETRPDSEPFPT